MLDVHPPHHAANTWRDFFIHIATIVIGLLIAIGLEQGVEKLHQRYEVRETQEALRKEREGNRQRLIYETTFWRRGTAALENNLLVLHFLQQNPGAPQEKLPGVLHWDLNHIIFARAAWDSAEKAGIVSLLPNGQGTEDAFLYLELQNLEDNGTSVDRAINDAEEYTLTDPNPLHLTPVQLADVVKLTEKALTLQILQGQALADLKGGFSDMPATVTPEEIHALRGEVLRPNQPPPPPDTPEGRTNARLDAAALDMKVQ